MERNIRDLMEKVKVTAAQAAQVAGKAADVAGKKAGEIVETTKLNLQVFDINTDIEILFKEIGKAVYLTHTGVEVDPEEIEDKVKIIDEKYQLIASLKDDINEKRTVIKCPNCGKECNKADVFCSACGFELK